MPQETRKNKSNGKGRGKKGRRLMTWEKNLIFLMDLQKAIKKQWRKQTTNLRIGDKINFTVNLDIEVCPEKDWGK